ncbi:MAG: hypothetical protein WAN65_22760 [Candidatus Sulfotelmatobacter sp.]
MASTDLTELVLRSTFIFAGTVESIGKSSVNVLNGRPGLAIARFDRPLRVNPVLGNLKGRPITVLIAKGGKVSPGEQLIIFANSWVHGEQIAVVESAQLALNPETERAVSDIVASLPERHLQERIASAVLIVDGVVKSVARAPEAPETASEHTPYWMRALIEIREVLKGQPEQTKATREEVQLYFPGSMDRRFQDVPKPKAGQSAIFLLHTPSGKFPPPGLVAPDPADVQPPEQLDAIRALIGAA